MKNDTYIFKESWIENLNLARLHALGVNNGLRLEALKI